MKQHVDAIDTGNHTDLLKQAASHGKNLGWISAFLDDCGSIGSDIHRVIDYCPCGCIDKDGYHIREATIHSIDMKRGMVRVKYINFPDPDSEWISSPERFITKQDPYFHETHIQPYAMTPTQLETIRPSNLKFCTPHPSYEPADGYYILIPDRAKFITERQQAFEIQCNEDDENTDLS